MINKVILVGNVGIDPEVRTLESGVKTARVRLATTERYYNRETRETTEHTEWHTITLWRNLADEVDRFVHKAPKSMSRDDSAPASGATRAATNATPPRFRPTSSNSWAVVREAHPPRGLPRAMAQRRPTPPHLVRL